MFFLQFLGLKDYIRKTDRHAERAEREREKGREKGAGGERERERDFSLSFLLPV